MPQISYDYYHTFLASVGLVSIFLSGTLIFLYITGDYAFTNTITLVGLTFVIIPGLIGIGPLYYGWSLWKERSNQRDEIIKQEIRERTANADIAKGRAESFDRRAETIDKVVIEGDEYELEDWNP